MAVEYITKVRKVKTKPIPKYLLLVLANYADSEGYSYPSHETLSDWTCLSLTAVKANLKKLKEEGLLTWERRSNTSNLYKITIGAGDDYHSAGNDYNTKVHTKVKYILGLDKISEIYKQRCSKEFYRHSSNTFDCVERHKKLKEIARKGVISPKTQQKVDLCSEEFWNKYFEIANGERFKSHVKTWTMTGKPRLYHLLNIPQFDAIIERRYG